MGRASLKLQITLRHTGTSSATTVLTESEVAKLRIVELSMCLAARLTDLVHIVVIQEFQVTKVDNIVQGIKQDHDGCVPAQAHSDD